MLAVTILEIPDTHKRMQSKTLEATKHMTSNGCRKKDNTCNMYEISKVMR